MRFKTCLRPVDSCRLHYIHMCIAPEASCGISNSSSHCEGLGVHLSRFVGSLELIPGLPTWECHFECMRPNGFYVHVYLMTIPGSQQF